MKKLYILLACLSAYGVNAQQNDSLSKSLFPEGTREYYLQKSKYQKTSAWFMVGCGLALSVAGVIQAGNNLFSLNRINDGVGSFVVGAGLALGSIPLFIASGRSKRSALLAVSGPPLSFNNKGQPAFLLKFILPIGK